MNYGEEHSQIFGEADDLWFRRRHADGTEDAFILWAWYLSALVSGMELRNGAWRSFACEYHVNSSWQFAPWPIADLAETISELRDVNTAAIAEHSFGREALAILPELIAFLEDAMHHGEAVTIESR